MCSENTIPTAFRQLIFFKFDHLWRGKTLNLLLLNPSLFDTSCAYFVAKQLGVRWWENYNSEKLIGKAIRRLVWAEKKKHLTTFFAQKLLVGGWTNPSEKYARQIWIISPNRGENKTYLRCHHLDFLGPQKKLGELPTFLDFAPVRCGWKKFPNRFSPMVDWMMVMNPKGSNPWKIPDFRSQLSPNPTTCSGNSLAVRSSLSTWANRFIPQFWARLKFILASQPTLP